MTSEELARRVGELALSKKAEEVMILELRNLTSVTDYFIICHGTSELHVKAIANAIRRGIDSNDAQLLNSEGYEFGRWILLDYVDVVVHVFNEEQRKFYNLENLWSDAPVTIIEDEAVRYDERDKSEKN